jgi:hypothetical protein
VILLGYGEIDLISRGLKKPVSLFEPKLVTKWLKGYIKGIDFMINNPARPPSTLANTIGNNGESIIPMKSF